MNAYDNQHPQDPHPDATYPPRARREPTRERREPVDASGAPEAVRARQVARDDKHHAVVRGRGVEWVRPTDLLARHAATAAGMGINFEAELARRLRGPLGAGVRRVGDRVRRLPPTSAFGRGSASRSAPVRSGIGMSPR